MGANGGGLTAAHIATALVAACKITGAEPTSVFEKGQANRKARLIAGAALKELGLAPAKALARTFQLGHPSQLSPSLLAQAHIAPEQLADCCLALRDAGLAPRVFEAAPAPAAEPPVQDKPARPQAVEAPARPAPAERKARPVVPERKPVRSEPDAPREKAAREAPPRWHDSGPGKRLAARQPLVAPARENQVRRLKPVTARILRWSRAYVARGVEPEFLAELFDVHPDALIDALNPATAEAA